MARGADFARDLDRRALGEPLDRPAGAVFDKLDEDVVAPLLVDQWRSLAPGGQHVHNRLQFLVVDPHGRGDVLGLRTRRSNARGHELTHVADFVTGQNWLAAMLETAQRGCRRDGFDVGQIFCREDRAPMLVGDVHIADAPVCYRASHKGDIERTGKMKIRNILAATAQKSVVFLARNAGTHSMARHAQPVLWYQQAVKTSLPGYENSSTTLSQSVSP